MSDKIPTGASKGTEGGVNPAQIERLPAPLHDAYIASFTDALHSVFVVATCVMVVAFLLAWFIQEKPLRQTVESSARRHRRVLRRAGRHRLAARDHARADAAGRPRAHARVPPGHDARAGIDLSPSAAWLLLRGGAPDAPDDITLFRKLPLVNPPRFDEALADLQAQGLVTANPPTHLTAEGQTIRTDLVAARTDGLRTLIADWSPDENPELDPLLRRLATELEPAA